MLYVCVCLCECVRAWVGEPFSHHVLAPPLFVHESEGRFHLIWLSMSVRHCDLPFLQRETDRACLYVLKNWRTCEWEGSAAGEQQTAQIVHVIHCIIHLCSPLWMRVSVLFCAYSKLDTLDSLSRRLLFQFFVPPLPFRFPLLSPLSMPPNCASRLKKQKEKRTGEKRLSQR